jgi:hypothetical protein
VKRIQLFEFEDFIWLPQPIRAGITNLIVVFHRMTGTQPVVAELVRTVRARHAFDRIVDLGAGSGGIMPSVLRELNAAPDAPDLELLLTDLHPAPENVARFNTDTEPEIRYRKEPLDATQLDQAPAGLKTMMNSFHHLPPAAARQVLHSAQAARQPLLIYEMAENKIPTLLWWLFLPLSLTILAVMTWFMTPFVRPLTGRQLLFTYLLPVIPLVYAWDGQASLVRMYTFDDLRQLLPAATDGYTWEMGPAEKPGGKTQGYYVLGLPK